MHRPPPPVWRHCNVTPASPEIHTLVAKPSAARQPGAVVTQPSSGQRTLGFLLCGSVLPHVFMPRFNATARRRFGGLAALCWLACAAQAQTTSSTPPPPSATTAGAVELRFAELFARPVGPKGLQPSAKLLALDGQRVRMVGYMVAAELPTPGSLVLTPLPASMGDEDEHLADDLPPQAVFVHLSGPAADQVLPNLAGLLRLQGTLSVGPQNEADGHVSTVRLLLDAPLSSALLASAPASP